MSDLRDTEKRMAAINELFVHYSDNFSRELIKANSFINRNAGKEYAEQKLQILCNVRDLAKSDYDFCSGTFDHHSSQIEKARDLLQRTFPQGIKHINGKPMTLLEVRRYVESLAWDVYKGVALKNLSIEKMKELLGKMLDPDLIVRGDIVLDEYFAWLIEHVNNAIRLLKEAIQEQEAANPDAASAQSSAD